MTNWVDTALRVTGPKEVLARFKEDAKTDESPISINKLYPMPKELENTRSPMDIISQEEYDEQERRIAANDLEDNERAFGVSRKLTQELSDKYKRKYGADNWYDWKVNSHGTKWDLCDVYLYDESEGELRYGFNTAWSPAENAWINYYRTGEGEDVPPPEAIEVYEAYITFNTATSAAEQEQAARTILDSQAENIWNIGVVGITAGFGAYHGDLAGMWTDDEGEPRFAAWDFWTVKPWKGEHHYFKTRPLIDYSESRLKLWYPMDQWEDPLALSVENNWF